MSVCVSLYVSISSSLPCSLTVCWCIERKRAWYGPQGTTYHRTHAQGPDKQPDERQSEEHCHRCQITKNISDMPAKLWLPSNCGPPVGTKRGCPHSFIKMPDDRVGLHSILSCVSLWVWLFKHEVLDLVIVHSSVSGQEVIVLYSLLYKNRCRACSGL